MTQRRVARVVIGGVARIVDLYRTMPAFAHVPLAAYGAVGDDATDNQAAITAAITAAKSDGLPVFVPPGTFRHSGQITLDGVVMFGITAATTTLHGTTVDGHAVNLTGTNPGLHNLAIEGPGNSPRSSNRAGNGVYVNTATGYVVRGCHIFKVSGAGVMVEASTGGLERGNRVELTGADGLYHTEGSNNLEVCYNRTYATGDDGISVTSYNDGGFVHDIALHHNSVLGNWQSRGMTVNGSSGGITLFSNHIDGGTAGISLASTSTWGGKSTGGVEAYGNTIRNINQTKQDIGLIGGGAFSFWNDLTTSDATLSFHDNVVFNPGVYGIFAGGDHPISGSFANNVFYMDPAAAANYVDYFGATHQPLRTLYVAENSGAAITESSDSRYPLAAYPGDLVPRTVGGLDPTYQYTP